MAVRTERSDVRTKTTKGQYSPVRLELAGLVSSLLYGSRTMLVLSLPAFENKKYTAYDRFHGNGPYGEILTEKEPIRTLGYTLPYNKRELVIIILPPSSSHKSTIMPYMPLYLTELNGITPWYYTDFRRLQLFNFFINYLTSLSTISSSTSRRPS